MTTRVIFSHGHLSSPSSHKIRQLTPYARRRGCRVEAIDYTDLRDDPAGRVERLRQAIAALDDPPVLVGSSLGGLVSVLAAETARVRGLFLLAPALYMEQLIPGGVQRECYRPNCDSITVVHGFCDEICRWQDSLRFAEQVGAELHLFQAGHRLESVLPMIEVLFDAWLSQDF